MEQRTFHIGFGRATGWVGAVASDSAGASSSPSVPFLAQCGVIACAVLLGCEPLLGVGREVVGSADHSVSAGPPLQPVAGSERSGFRHGSFVVEREEDRVTVRAHSAYRVAVLAALSEDFDFDLVVHDIPAWAVSVDVESVELAQALGAVLEGTPYTLRYGENEETEQHGLLAVEFGKPRVREGIPATALR